MLIVNADDYGVAPSATDAILETIEAGVVSSASAMVWMPDTERSATLAQERGLRLGLHLNLTLPFYGEDVPAGVAERQLPLTEQFDKDSWSNGRARRVDRSDVRAAVKDQLDRFRELFGEPTHINGHHHVHVIDAVLDVLPPAIPIRQVPTTPGRVQKPERRMDKIRTRFRAPWATVDFTTVHPAFGGHPLTALADLTTFGAIEVVTHPQLEPQREALLGEPWRAAVADLGLATYSDL